jgi:hypothetical protein
VRLKDGVIISDEVTQASKVLSYVWFRSLEGNFSKY